MPPMPATQATNTHTHTKSRLSQAFLQSHAKNTFNHHHPMVTLAAACCPATAADLPGLARVSLASRCKLGPRRTESSGLAW
eukprot:2331634-Amphidinium_carterae.1